MIEHGDGSVEPDDVEPRSDVVHVYPVKDLVDHLLTEDCICGPTIEAAFREDGSNGWVIVHSALDGRE